MAWLSKINGAVNVNVEGIRPHYPFEAGRVYWQLDLDGRDAVEGIGAHYSEEDKNVGYFSEQIIKQLEEQRAKDLGSVAIYLRQDSERPLAYAFISEDAQFVPTPPQ